MQRKKIKKIIVRYIPTGATFTNDAIKIIETPDRFEIVEEIRHGVVTLSTSYHKSLFAFEEV